MRKLKKIISIALALAIVLAPIEIVREGNSAFFDGSSFSVSASTADAASTARLKTPAVKIAGMNRYIKLSWSKISGAAKYEIYRANYKSGTYKLIKTTTRLYYKDSSVKKGNTYYYKVRAIPKSSKYAKSYFSKVKSSSLFKGTLTLFPKEYTISVGETKNIHVAHLNSDLEIIPVYDSSLFSCRWIGEQTLQVTVIAAKPQKEPSEIGFYFKGHPDTRKDVPVTIVQDRYESMKYYEAFLEVPDFGAWEGARLTSESAGSLTHEYYYQYSDSAGAEVLFDAYDSYLEALEYAGFGISREEVRDVGMARITYSLSGMTVSVCCDEARNLISVGISAVSQEADEWDE